MAIHARRLPTDSKVAPGVLIESDERTEPTNRTEPAEPIAAPHTEVPVATLPASPSAQVERKTSRTEKPSALTAVKSPPWYRTERWFLVQLASLIPTLLAFAVPRAMRPPFWIAGGALLLVGLLMMARNELRRGRSVTDFDSNAT